MDKKPQSKKSQPKKTQKELCIKESDMAQLGYTIGELNLRITELDDLLTDFVNEIYSNKNIAPTFFTKKDIDINGKIKITTEKLLNTITKPYERRIMNLIDKQQSTVGYVACQLNLVQKILQEKFYLKPKSHSTTTKGNKNEPL